MVGKRKSFRGRASGGRSVKKTNHGRTAAKNNNRSLQPNKEDEQSKRNQEKLRQKTEESNVKLAASVAEDKLTFQNERNVYNELLFSLQGKGGSFADAYARRQREEQGASSSDEEEEEDEELEQLDNGLTHSGKNSEDDEIDEVQEDESALKVKDGLDHDNSDDDCEEDGEEVAGKDEENEVEKEEEVEEDDDDDDDNDNDNDDDDDDDDDNDDDDEGHDSQASLDGDVGDDTASNRAASHGQAGICSDPFRCHLEYQINVSEETNVLQSLEKSSEKIPAEGTPGMSWVFSQSPNLPTAENSLAAYAVKKRLQDSWRKVYGKSSHGDFKSELQRQFYSFCTTYKDILHTNRSVVTGSSQKSEEDLTFMDAYVAHILNHLMKTRDLITKDNEKVRLPSVELSDPPRDQGYTRPKVLVLLPFRSCALTFVTSLLKLMPPPQNANVENKGRFFDDFGVAKNVEADSDIQSTKETRSAKPADFDALFNGNNDDHFRIGIKFTRKSVKLYTEFYSSDIIIASPLGLITKIGEADAKKDKDVDFLSSIEIVVLDYTDVTLMQNWSHVMSVFDYLNQLPVHQHGTDFMRIREWYLNGHARRYRQTIIISAFPDAGVNALFRRSCINHAGKVKSQCEYEGILSKIVLQVRQVFEKVQCTQISEVDDARFEFFVKQVFPQVKNSLQGGTMIFIRTYFDYVRLRNFLKAESSSVCLLGEYTGKSNISRARSSFFHGKRKIILYTQRAHFFHRFKIRGIKDLIFYSLPDQAHFYVELLNMLEGNENPSCTVLFSRFDILQASYFENVKEDAIRPLLLSHSFSLSLIPDLFTSSPWNGSLEVLVQEECCHHRKSCSCSVNGIIPKV